MTETLSPRQVARALGVSEASIKRWCDQGLIETLRTPGGHRKVDAASVRRFLRESGRPAASPRTFGAAPEPAVPLSGDEESAEIYDALTRGDERGFRELAFRLYLRGQSMAAIGDDAIAPVFERIGSSWEDGGCDIYQERRAVEVCLRWLHEVSTAHPPMPGRPKAIGGTLTGDPYALGSTLVEVVLRLRGWDACSYGSLLTADTLVRAIQREEPRVVWLSVSNVADGAAFAGDVRRIFDATVEQGALLVLGGRALDEAVRRRLPYSCFCDHLRHLEAFAVSVEAS